MKKISFLIAVLLTYASCYKITPIPKSTAAPTFDILAAAYSDFGSSSGNLKDSAITISLRDSSSVSLRLDFRLLSGNPENFPVTCSVSGLPPGFSCTPGSVNFELSYIIEFNISAQTDTGIYAATVFVTTPIGSNIYPIRIHVGAVRDCATGLTGIYNGSDPCGHLSLGDIWYTYQAIVDPVAGQPNVLAIKNFRGLGDSIVVYAHISCGGGVAIPVQTCKGYTFMGRGSAYYSTQDNNGKPWISIYRDTIIHNGDTQTCATQLKM